MKSSSVIERGSEVSTVEFEGELKLIKNFFSSRKDTYRLVDHFMLIKKETNVGKVDYK